MRDTGHDVVGMLMSLLEQAMLPDLWLGARDARDAIKVSIVAVDTIQAALPHQGGMSPGPSYSARFDLNADGVVGLQDILTFIPFFNVTCTP